jgi:hypothetical protein
MLVNWLVGPESAENSMLSRCQCVWTISLEDLSTTGPFRRLSTPSDFRQDLWNLGKSTILRGLAISLAGQPYSTTHAVWRVPTVWFPWEKNWPDSSQDH